MLKWILSSLMVCTIGCAKAKELQQKASALFPTSTAEFASTSVKILNAKMNSGGSGVIISSSDTGSKILTNKHVCGVIQNGGVVKSHSQEVSVASYKLYPKHDLCLVTVRENLGVDTHLASKEPAIFSDINVSGHPALLPYIRSKGHLSDKRIIAVMIDTKKCDGKEEGDEKMYCAFLGAKPIIQDFDSQLVSALIMPGSSGSGVFTTGGELMGLVFAGSGDGLGYGSIVPFKYLQDFLANEALYPVVTPDSTTPSKNFFKMLAKGRELCASRNPKFRKLCSTVRFQPIYLAR